MPSIDSPSDNQLVKISARPVAIKALAPPRKPAPSVGRIRHERLERGHANGEDRDGDNEREATQLHVLVEDQRGDPQSDRVADQQQAETDHPKLHS